MQNSTVNLFIYLDGLVKIEVATEIMTETYLEGTMVEYPSTDSRSLGSHHGRHHHHHQTSVTREMRSNLSRFTKYILGTSVKSQSTLQMTQSVTISSSSSTSYKTTEVTSTEDNLQTTTTTEYTLTNSQQRLPLTTTDLPKTQIEWPSRRQIYGRRRNNTGLHGKGFKKVRKEKILRKFLHSMLRTYDLALRLHRMN